MNRRRHRERVSYCGGVSARETRATDAGQLQLLYHVSELSRQGFFFFPVASQWNRVEWRIDYSSLKSFSAWQGCARLMSRESNLTRLWLKWVESELSRPWNQGYQSNQSRVPSVAEWSKALESDASAGGESPVRAPVRAATLCPYA